jgi:hypothetical protein
MDRTRSFLLPAAALALGLGACSAIGAPATLDSNALATVVSGTLTAVPTLPLPPEATATEIPLIPTEAPPEATATPEVETITPSPQPTDTQVPTSTAGPTSTLPAEDVRGTLGNPTWSDPLTSGNNWPLGEDSFTRARVEDGELHMIGLTTTDGWRLTWPVVRNFYLEMTVRTGSCSSNDHYGLMARVPDRSAADHGYLFGFTCDGRYSLRAWDGEEMTSLVAPTAGTAINAGSDKVNRIGLWAKGEQLGLYANGSLLTQIEDGTFTEEGSFGIFVGARQTDEFTVHVDEIAYWDNP